MIDPIKHYALEGPASIYDEESMTALELAGRTAGKVNEVVKAQNTLEQRTENHLQEQDDSIRDKMDAQDEKIAKDIPAKVTEEVQKKIDSGEFDRAISAYAGNLSDRVDNLLENIPEGSTTMDAEIVDIRTLEKERHTTAGNAVRAIDKRVNNLTTRADGGSVCFAPTDVSKVSGWTGETHPAPECVAIGEDSLTWYYTPDITINNPGVSIPIENKAPGAEYVYIELDMAKVTGNNTVSVWVASADGYVEGQCKKIVTLDKNTNYRTAVRVSDYAFEINKVWIIVHADPDDGYLNLWVKVTNLCVYTNTLKDAGFSGNTIDSHLLELRGLATDKTIGTDILAKSGDEVYKPWAGASGTTESIANNATGDFGVGYYFGGKVDPGKLLHIEFDLDTDFNNFDLYLGSWISMGKDHSTLAHITAGGHYEYTIDPAYYSVYVGFDPASIFLLSHSTENNPVSWELKNLRVYQNAVVDVGGVESLEENLVKLYRQEPKAVTTSENVLTAPNGYRYLVQVNDAGVLAPVPVDPEKTLYIGNSLLVGFNGFGMAATAPDKDYYSLINSAFKSKRSTHTANKTSGSEWENMASIGAKMGWCSSTLGPLLSSDLDLVIVQLGDNVNTNEKKAVLEEGAKQMLRYIRQNAPNARVVWVGVWYGADNIQAIQNACKATGCLFINILDLHTKDNESAIGNTWTDNSGNVNEITSAGVASHPGDSGFKAIANRVLFKLGVTDNENYYT